MIGSITIRRKVEAGVEVEQVTKVPLVFYDGSEEDISGSNAEYMWDSAMSNNIEISFSDPGHAVRQLRAAVRALVKLFPQETRDAEMDDIRTREEQRPNDRTFLYGKPEPYN
jgi:hypothetical protein